MKQVQSIFEIIKICAEGKQKRFENLKMVDYLPQNFNDDFVGKKVKKEIRREIKRGEKRKFMVVLQRNIGDLEQAKKWRIQLQNAVLTLVLMSKLIKSEESKQKFCVN